MIGIHVGFSWNAEDAICSACCSCSVLSCKGSGDYPIWFAYTTDRDGHGPASATLHSFDSGTVYS